MQSKRILEAEKQVLQTLIEEQDAELTDMKAQNEDLLRQLSCMLPVDT